MRTEQAGLAQLRGYQAEMARPQVRAAERGEQGSEGAASRPEAGEEAVASQPRDLGKGKLLDIYG